MVEKFCPHCGSKINYNYYVCPHCTRTIVPPRQSKLSLKIEFWSIWITFALFVLWIWTR